MILKPNYNNDTEYRFILLYDENINKYNLNYSLFIEDTDITCKFINKDLENKIIEAILNRLNITYNNSNINLMDWITISYNREPYVVYGIENIRGEIVCQLLYSIEASDNFIIPENAKTTIPYFKLKAWHI